MARLCGAGPGGAWHGMAWNYTNGKKENNGLLRRTLGGNRPVNRLLRIDNTMTEAVDLVKLLEATPAKQLYEAACPVDNSHLLVIYAEAHQYVCFGCHGRDYLGLVTAIRKEARRVLSRPGRVDV